MNFYKRLELKDFSHAIDKLVRCKIGEGHISGDIFRNDNVSGFFFLQPIGKGLFSKADLLELPCQTAWLVR